MLSVQLDKVVLEPVKIIERNNQSALLYREVYIWGGGPLGEHTGRGVS